MLESQYNTLAIQEQEETTSEEMLTNFENDISRAKASVSDLKLSDGLTSIIWIKDNVVVSRELTTEIGKNSDSILIDVKGNQIIDPKESSLDYQMTFEDRKSVVSGKRICNR